MNIIKKPKNNFRKHIYKIYNDDLLLCRASINSLESYTGEYFFKRGIEKIKDVKYADYWIVDKRKFK